MSLREQPSTDTALDTRFTVRLDETQTEKLEDLVDDGEYRNWAEAVRAAIDDLPGVSDDC